MAVIKINDEVVYEGPLVAVPREGDEVLRNGEARRVESVTWEFSGTGSDGVTVTLHVGDVSYTF
jgi:hypothetical protein